MSLVMTDRACHICHSNWASGLSRGYWAHVSGYETQLGYLWQSLSLCWNVIDVQLRPGGLCAYHYDRLITVNMAIPGGNGVRLADIKSLCQNIWHLFTYLWQCCSFCWYIIEAQVHWRVLGTYHYHWSITAYLPIPVGNTDSLGHIE